MKKIAAITASVFVWASPASFASALSSTNQFASSSIEAIDAPPFDPAQWIRLKSSICYPYVLNDVQEIIKRYSSTPDAPVEQNEQPGAISGVWATTAVDTDSNDWKTYAAAIVDMAKADGLQYTNQTLEIKKGFYPVALYFKHHVQITSHQTHSLAYHWIRINGGNGLEAGLWSEKFSGQDPKLVRFSDGSTVKDPSHVNLDSNGIAYKQSAACKDCYEFGGYFEVPAKGLAVNPNVVKGHISFIKSWIERQPPNTRPQWRQYYKNDLSQTRVRLMPVG